MHKTLRGTIYALIAGICWGFSGTVGQFLFSRTQMDSGWLTTVRLLSAGAILLVMAAVKNPQSLTAVWKDKKDALQLVFFGVAGLMAVQYCYMEAIYYSDSGTATAVQYTGEAMLLVYTCVTARRLPKPSEFFGLLLALFGIFLLATHGSFTGLALSPGGLFWGLSAAVALMIYTAAPGRLISKFGSTTVTAYGMLIGGAALALLLRVRNIPGTYTPTEALDFPDVKVMMKNNLPATLSALRESGANAAMVENCGMENEKIYRTLEDIPEDAGYFSLLIVK